jgi:hypothetical protein
MKTQLTFLADAGKYLVMALVVLSCCLILFSIDKETHSFNDLLKASNLMALVVYFIPTYLISCIFYTLFIKKKNKLDSLVLSLLIGIPSGFTLVIIGLLFYMGRL